MNQCTMEKCLVHGRFLTTVKGLIAGYQTHVNHAGDEDLKKLLEEAIEGGQQEVKQLKLY